jgi:hypothetical protein
VSLRAAAGDTAATLEVAEGAGFAEAQPDVPSPRPTMTSQFRAFIAEQSNHCRRAARD